MSALDREHSPEDDGTPEKDPNFFWHFLRKPRQMSMLKSSGPAMARALADVDYGVQGKIIELGAGGGAVTAAIAAHTHYEMGRLVVIEYEKAFCRLLRRKFKGATVIQGDARDLEEMLLKHGIEHVAHVISCLPNHVMEPPLVESIRNNLGPDGTLRQMTMVPLNLQRFRRRYIDCFNSVEFSRVWEGWKPAGGVYKCREPIVPV